MRADLERLRDIVHNLDSNVVKEPAFWLDRELLPGQRRFLELPHKYRLFAGGVGSGKSYIGALLALSRCRPGNDGLIVAPTFRMLSTVGQSLLLDHLNDADCSYVFKKSEELLDYNGARVYFRSAERPDLIRGLSVNWAWLDEGSLMPESLWRVVLGRLRIGEPEAWITTTPAGFNWLHDYFVDAGSDEYGYISARTVENRFLPAEYITSLERNYTGGFKDQELCGAFTAQSGLVYPEFDREVHLVDPFPIPDSWLKVGAIDFGFIHPFAAAWVAFDEDGRGYVYQEYKKAETLLKDHAAVLKAHPVRYRLSDHDSQDRQELAALGVRTYAAIKDVVPGIQAVKARLAVQGDGRPRLYVFRNCTEIVKEFGSYVWFNTLSQTSDAEKVVKQNDDLLDALRYVLYFEDRKQKARRVSDVLSRLAI